MSHYDPVETQTLAEELQKRAADASLYSTLYGVAIGAFLMGPWFISMRWIVFSILGGLLGGFIGFRFGQTRALSLRAQAQTLLCLITPRAKETELVPQRSALSFQQSA